MLNSITQLALEEIAERSRKRIYQTDYLAWCADVLGSYTYEKMQEVTHEALFGPKQRTVVKSANGVSKSFEQAKMILYLGSAFDPGENKMVISAPSLKQVESVVFSYLKEQYGIATLNGFKPQGWLSEQSEWKVATSSGNQEIAIGRVPAKGGSELSVFQGVRSMSGTTWVFFEEAGGMSNNMWTGMEAILTGDKARFFGIGNPDITGNTFHQIYQNDEIYGDIYNRFTISAFDLPGFTGERVYPHTEYGDKMEQQMLDNLTSPSWVEEKKHIWGETDPRYLSKVLGEFSGEASSAFFTQSEINTSYETDIPEDADEPLYLGCDIARFGDDETVIYSNQGGRLRFVDSWGKTDTVETSRKIHRHAVELGASEVRIDSSGIGGSVYDQLQVLEEFQSARYTLLGIDGGSRAPDSKQYAQVRSYLHGNLKDMMREGLIDLDIKDEHLTQEIMNCTFGLNARGAVQVTPKKDMKAFSGKSPDFLDAALYAVAPVGGAGDGPLAGVSPGDVLMIDPTDYFEELILNGAGRPL